VKLGGATGSAIWGRRVGITGSFLPGAVAVAPASDPDKLEGVQAVSHRCPIRTDGALGPWANMTSSKETR